MQNSHFRSLRIIGVSTYIKHILILFLDIQTVYSIRCINNKFNYISNLIFNKYSFICGFLCNDIFSNKITILINPSIRNLKLLVKYTCKKKTLFFMNSEFNLNNILGGISWHLNMYNLAIS